VKEIDAHLRAAEKNNAGKRPQHLIAATVYAEQAGVPHFGRWNERALVARNARAKQREQMEKFQR